MVVYGLEEILMGSIEESPLTAAVDLSHFLTIRIARKYGRRFSIPARKACRRLTWADIIKNKHPKRCLFFIMSAQQESNLRPSA